MAAIGNPHFVNERSPILVLGIGNILLRDEGVGVRVVEALQAMNLRTGVEVVDGGTLGLGLLDILAGRRKVIVIDAVKGSHAPGTVLRLRPEDLQAGAAGGLSPHDAGLLETLGAARDLGCVPGEVVIFGIQVKEIAWGLPLSHDVAAVIPRVIEQVMIELKT